MPQIEHILTPSRPVLALPLFMLIGKQGNDKYHPLTSVRMTRPGIEPATFRTSERTELNKSNRWRGVYAIIIFLFIPSTPFINRTELNLYSLKVVKYSKRSHITMYKSKVKGCICHNNSSVFSSMFPQHHSLIEHN